MDQWVPIINLPERWTFGCKKSVKWLLSAQEKWCGPWWTHCHPEIKFQSTADEERRIWRKKRNLLLSTWDVFVWSYVCQPLHPSWDNEALAASWRGNQKACELFNVKVDTVRKDYVMYLFGKASVTSQKSEETPEHGTVEWTKAFASLCRNKTLVETLDLCNFTYLI